MEYMYKVGDIFEYPETGEYEKLRGERIVVLEKGKGNNSGHTYIRALCFRPDVENDSYHFSCNDRYMDKILEHWRFAGHMDISLLVGGKEEKKKWEVTDEDLPLILESLKEVSIDVKCDDSKDRLREDAEELLQDLKNCIDPNYQCCDCPYNEDCAGRDELMKEVIRVLGLLLEKTYKLEEENAKLAQKISCADKLLAEAANRLYQGRAHLNITAHN